MPKAALRRWRVIAVDQDVARPEVAMNDELAVRVLTAPQTRRRARSD